MNRTDRLVAIVMWLQARRVVTAAELATHFEVSERTIYRDLAALSEGGVPIAGEPGVGYRLMHGYRLPPVMFTAEEAAALVTGGMLAEEMTDHSVRGPMRTALAKVTAILPADQQHLSHRLREAMSVQASGVAEGAVTLFEVQSAVACRQVMRLTTRDPRSGEVTEGEVEPIGLVHCVGRWHLIAWCRLRNDVHDFRVDEILRCQVQPEPLPRRHEFALRDHLSSYCGEAGARGVVIEVHPALEEMVRHYGGLSVASPRGDTGWKRFHILTPSLDYTARWIVGLGEMVTVIEPAELAERVLAVAEAAFQHHKKVPAKRS